MPTPIAHNDDYQKFALIPEDVRQKMLEIRTQIDVTIKRISICKNDACATSRLRWRVDGSHPILSIGKDEQVIALIKEVLTFWRDSEFPLISLAFPDEKFVPYNYHDKWKKAEQPWEEEIRDQLDKRIDLKDATNTSEGDEYVLAQLSKISDAFMREELSIYRPLSQRLIMELIAMKDKVNVNTANLNVVYREDRRNWCLRWRSTSKNAKQKSGSLNFGKSDLVAKTVKHLIEEWKQLKYPLLSLVCSGGLIPPKYWGLDIIDQYNKKHGTNLQPANL